MVLRELAVIALRHTGTDTPVSDEAVKVSEQLKALEMIGKYLGMFRDAAPDEPSALTLVCDYGRGGGADDG